MERLVRDWNERGCTVAVTGTAIELQKLLECTCIREAQLVGFVPLEAAEAAVIADLGQPVWNLEALASQPPQVLLVASTLGQRQLCERFAGQLTRFGVEITGFYETGAQF